MPGFPLRYIKYWLYATEKHSLHAPFIYSFFTEVIKSKKEYYCFKHLKTIKNKLYTDGHVINIKDYGAGSLKSQKKQREVRDIARSGLSTTKFSQFLFKLIDYYKPQNVVELGTSLGLNTLYLSSYSSNIQVTTFEGCPETAQYAKNLFFQEKRTNVDVIEGNIDVTLPAFIDKQEKIDFIYFDANHSFEPTLRYFHTCLEKMHERSVFIFDDIHWSSEMERAWANIKDHPDVRLTIDIFDAGIVLFNTRFKKDHYILEF